jgi:hypothetical protein
VESDIGGEPVVLVNETLVSQFFPGRDPVGARVKPPWGGGVLPWFTIVGVLEDVRQGGLGEPPGTELYLLADQVTRLSGPTPSQMQFVARSARAAADLAPEIRRIVRDLDAGVPVVGLRSMDEVIDASIAGPRLIMLVLSVFAGVALALAAVGTYGALALLVSARTREYGIRMAMGAGRREILALVLRRGLLLSLAGLAIGLAASQAASRLAATLLHGLRPPDPLTLAGVAIVIFASGLTACLVPALRATRVDPVVALRND